jgi:hypothetical protein
MASQHNSSLFATCVVSATAWMRPGRRIGAWCATKLATDAGGWRQINRGGFPMMWPIFWPGDTNFSDPANTRHPAQDFAAEGGHLAGQVAAVVAASGTVDDAEGYGRAVAAELLPDVLPYEVGTQATFSFAGRNGRPMADNAPEAMMSLVAGFHGRGAGHHAPVRDESLFFPERVRASTAPSAWNHATRSPARRERQCRT